MSKNKKYKISGNEMMAFFLHQDNIMWNQLQTIGVIQIASLGAAYSLKETFIFSILIIILGAILTILMFFFIKRSEISRINLENQINELNFSPKRKWSAPLKGREIAWIILSLLLSLDVIFIIAIYFKLLKIN